MSRCFPYPPPGYCRNGASYDALIESIKLQKETNKTKTDRKKEKRANKEKKDKRQKEKRNGEDQIKSHKNTNGDSHKMFRKAADYTEAQIKETANATTELLEKSDLTEEHGPSIGLHQPSYSSDSTQNSNKRKRNDDCSQPESSSGHGKPLKIRFLKKHKGSESSNFVADVISNTHESVPSVSAIRFNGVPATSGIENRAQTTVIRDASGSQFCRIQSTPSTTKPIIQPSRPHPPPVLSFGRQVVTQSHLERAVPSVSVSRNFVGPQKQLAPSCSVISNPVVCMPSTSGAVKRHIDDNLAPKNDDDKCHKKQKEEPPQKVAPTRTEKKILKKHAKYEKLLGSWLPPPVVQALLPDVGDDDDWLSRSKTPKLSISKSEEGETCRQMVAPWQPCARFLADVDLHALPYTVPF